MTKSKPPNWFISIQSPHNWWRSRESLSDFIHRALLEERKKMIEKIKGMKKTTGILGILGTTHRAGVVNEGYNQAIDDVLSLLDSSVKEKKITRRYKEGGYVVEEHPEPGITVLSMDSKGFHEEFAKPLFKKAKKEKLPPKIKNTIKNMVWMSRRYQDILSTLTQEK